MADFLQIGTKYFDAGANHGAVVMTPDRSKIISGCPNKTIRVWDVASQQCVWTLTGHASNVFCLAVTPDGKTLLSGSGDHTIRVWDLASGHCLQTLSGHSNLVRAIAVTADGKRFFSGSFDTTIRAWDLASGRCLQTFTGHADYVRSLAITRDDTMMISGGSLDIRVWDIASSRCLHTLTGHTSTVLSLTVSPDGKHVISGSADNSICVWDLASGRCMQTLADHYGDVYGVAVTPDGRQLISGSVDASARVWDLASGRCVQTLTGHSHSVWYTAVSADGSEVISISAGATTTTLQTHRTAETIKTEETQASVVEKTKTQVTKATDDVSKPCEIIDLDSKMIRQIPKLLERAPCLESTKELDTVATLRACQSFVNTFNVMGMNVEASGLDALGQLSRVEHELASNSAEQHMLTLKLSNLGRQLRKQVDSANEASKTEIRKLLMHGYEKRERLLTEFKNTHWFVNRRLWENRDRLRDVTGQNAGKKVETKELDASMFSSLCKAFTSIFKEMTSIYIPLVNRLQQLDSELGVWESKALTWYAVFLMAPELPALSAAAKEHRTIVEKLRGFGPSFLERLWSCRLEMEQFIASVLAAAETAVDPAKLSAMELDLTTTRVRLQEMREIEVIASKIQQSKKANATAKSETNAAMKRIEMLRVEIKFAEEAARRQQLQSKLATEERQLAELTQKAQNVRDLVRLHEMSLRSDFPELLGEDDGNGSVITGAGTLRRAQVIDDSVTIDQYPFEKWLVLDKVSIRKDPHGQICVVKKLVGSKQVRREAERLCKLQHPLIVGISKVFEDATHGDSICYMQMPYYEHGNLRAWVQRMQTVVQTHGYLPEHGEFAEVQQTFRQLVQALAHVHTKGVVHRDLKPENVLVAKGGKIALCDFGISADFATDFSTTFSAATTTTAMAGRHGYVAPEVLNGTREWRKHATAVDMWALGCMLAELLLPVFPRAFGSAGGSTSLQTAELLGVKWPTLSGFFARTPHMQALVRLISQLLREQPAERLTAHEVLLDGVLYTTTAAAARYDPITQANLVLSRLVESRKRTQPPVVINLPFTLEAEGDTGEQLCKTILTLFKDTVPDLHVPVRFRDAQGDHPPLSEVMDTFFRQIVMPKYGLFTQSVAASASGNGEEDEMLMPPRAFLPTVNGNVQQLHVVGMLLAKCLLEGVRVPVVFNSCCLEWLLGRTTSSSTPANVDECLSWLAETNEAETTLYRKILLTRQDALGEYALTIGTLFGSDSEQVVTDAANKQRVVCEAIWHKLVGCRLPSLVSLRDGLSKLDGYNELRAVPGKELQLLFYGNDFVEVDAVKQSVRFLEDAWRDGAKLASMQTWINDWLQHASEVTLRLLLCRVFQSLVSHAMGEGGRLQRMTVVPSEDEHVRFVARGLLALPTDCASYESLELRLGQALLMSSTKSEDERRQQLSHQEMQAVVRAMGGEIRAGGWFQCPNGHVYAVGECGGPMQTSTCPECGATIGGQGHRSAAGNTHATVDGSRAAAWPQ